MKFLKILTTSLLCLLISPMAQASFNLKIKIGQVIANQIIEVNKTIKADYDQEIIIKPEGLKGKLVLNLKKITNVIVDGNSLTPVQIDMKLVNDLQKTIGQPQTITSFYDRSAQFAVRSTGIASDSADINVSLNFEETNH